mgnify:CR=1 FL=1
MGRKKKVEETLEPEIQDSSINDIPIQEEAPKKRGRKPKFNKDFCSKYPDYISNIIVPGVSKCTELINRIFRKEDDITKEEWIEVKDNVQFMLHDLCHFNTFYFTPFPDNISKKAPSQIRGIDKFHEKNSKELILKYLDGDMMDEPGKSVMVFLHLKKYVFEASKECKL